jgi:CheY-like chemotaxis protein
MNQSSKKENNPQKNTAVTEVLINKKDRQNCTNHTSKNNKKEQKPTEGQTMKKILIVEDEPELLQAEIDLLTTWKYEVKGVDNARKAITLLGKEKFDLVLLDILMPIMSGTELAKYIRKQPDLKEQKIVFLTVVQLGEMGKMAIKELNPIDYVTKPFDNNDLRKRLKKALGGLATSNK